MLVTVLSFLLVLGVLVVVHELGHFATAKLFGIRVLEFGIGYPPRLWGFRRGGTLFSLNLLPLGGFVKLLGEEDPSDPQSLAAQGTGVRCLVLLAGPVMNALLPVVIFTALFMTPRQVVVGDVRILKVAPDSPAAGAGILPGDRVVRIDDRRVDNAADVSLLVHLNLGAETPWELERDGQLLRASLTPRFRPPHGQGPTGVQLTTERVQVTQVDSGSLAEAVGFRAGDKLLALGEYPIGRQEALPKLLELVRSQEGRTVADLQVWRSDHLLALAVSTDAFEEERLLSGLHLTTATLETRSLPPWRAVPSAVTHLWEILVLAKNEVVSWIVGQRAPALTGPIGIAQITGEVTRAGFLPVLEFAALLSLNLAIFNVLPIPALDGGRLLFVVIEWVRRGKRISPQREGLVHLIGFALLLALMAVITLQDIGHLLRGESLFP